MMHSRPVVLAAALLLVLSASGALAQSSITIPIQASIGRHAGPMGGEKPVDVGGCLVGAAGINFGSVSPSLIQRRIMPFPSASSSGNAYSVTGAITISCGSSAPGKIAVALDNGTNGVGSMRLPAKSTATRAMSNGSRSLVYDLLKPVIGTGMFVNALPKSALSSINMTGTEWGSADPPMLSISCQFIDGSLLCTQNQGGPGSVLTITPDLYASLLPPDSGVVIIPVVATIPSGQFQSLTPGVYTDNITVTVTF